MGLLDRLKKAVADHAGELGEMDVPGEKTFRFPAGKVKLTFQVSEVFKTSSGGRILDVPDELEVTLRRADSGEELELKGSQQGARSSVDSVQGWSRRGFGYVEVPEADDYVVRASGIENAESKTVFKYVEPKVLFGP